MRFVSIKYKALETNIIIKDLYFNWKRDIPVEEYKNILLGEEEANSVV